MSNGKQIKGWFVRHLETGGVMHQSGLLETPVSPGKVRLYPTVIQVNAAIGRFDNWYGAVVLYEGETIDENGNVVNTKGKVVR